MWLVLNKTRLPWAAAITGHSPAGGCLVSLCADERVMANDGKFRIGLNETQLGIVAPSWFVDSFVMALGQRRAERNLQLGRMLDVEQALTEGLVDYGVPLAEVRSTASQLVQSY